MFFHWESAHLFEFHFRLENRHRYKVESPERAIPEYPHVQRAVLPATNGHNSEGIEPVLC